MMQPDLAVLGVLVVLVAAATATAETGVNSSCFPAAPTGTPVTDTKSSLAISATVAGVPSTGFCPGVAYNLVLKFPEQRNYTPTATQGTISAANGVTCTNRFSSSTPVTSVSLQYTVPCSATGNLTLTVASAPVNQAGGATTYYRLVQSDLAVATAAACHATIMCKPVLPKNDTPRELKFLTFPKPKIVYASLRSPNSTRMVDWQLFKPWNFTDLKFSLAPNVTGLQLKLPNFTLPDLAKMLKVAKANATAGNKQAASNLTKVNIDLSAPKIPAVAKVKLNVSAADAVMLQSLPKVSETLMSMLTDQIKQKASIMGVELVDIPGAIQADISTAATAAGTSGVATASSAGRRLSATTTSSDSTAQKNNVLTILSRTGTLFYDGFSVLRATMNVISNAAVLVGSMMTGIITGTVSVDAVEFFKFCTNVSNLGSELGHLIGRVFSVNADAIAPLGLARDPVTGQIIL